MSGYVEMDDDYESFWFLVEAQIAQTALLDGDGVSCAGTGV